MHFIVSWDIKTPEPEFSRLNDLLKQCLKGYSWVRPLKTVYVVKVNSNEEKEVIKQQLKDVAKENQKKINILISPLMEGGSYSGWLPVDLWEKLKKRTV